MIGREGILIEDVAFAIGNHQFTPVHQERILAISERYLVEIAIGIGFLCFTRPLLFAEGWQGDAFQVFVKRFV